VTQDQAQRLGSYILDSGLDATIMPIERGDVYCLKIYNPCYFLWSFADWNEFCKEAKHRRKQQRRERPAINPAEPYSLALA
jgi:hypothetical protein